MLLNCSLIKTEWLGECCFCFLSYCRLCGSLQLVTWMTIVLVSCRTRMRPALQQICGFMVLCFLLASELPVNNVLGKIYRGFVSGMIPIIPLDKIVAQNEVSSAEKFHFDVASGAFAKKRSSAKKSTMSDFLFRLSMRSNGLAYIGIVFTVDEAVWGGSARSALVVEPSGFGRHDVRRTCFLRPLQSGALSFPWPVPGWLFWRPARCPECDAGVPLVSVVRCP